MAVWLAFVAASLALGTATGTNTLEGDDFGTGDSSRAERALAGAFPSRSDESVLVQGTRSGELRAVVRDVVGRLRRTEHVRAVEDPYSPGNGDRISRDGRSALVGFEVPGDADDRVDASMRTVAELRDAHPGFRIDQVGDASVDRALDDAHEQDMRKAELLSLPITLVLLLLAFGALVAAVIPLFIGFSASAAAIGLIGPVSQVAPVARHVSFIVLLIGLAVGIDYSMFYLRREREERARGADPQAALVTAAATSGRAVLISGLTVMIAMAGMYLAGAAGFGSFATGTILVVAIAVIGSLTALPATLSKLGDRVNKGRLPLLRPPERRAAGESRTWAAVLDRVLRRPLAAALAAAGLLALLAVPALGIHTAINGYEGLPHDLEVRKTYDRIQRAFPGGPAPAAVVVAARDTPAPRVSTAVDELRRRAGGATTVHVSPDSRVAQIAIPLAGDGTDDRSNAALADLRERLVPATLGRVPGVSAHVTGLTAQSKDLTDRMWSRLPIVLGFVLAAAFLLLLIAFRSIAIALTAIVLNLLSVGAALGFVTWVFQDGHFESLLDFRSTGTIEAFLPVFLFVILFGLSMDYHVFILSRIRESHLTGMSTQAAIAHAIKASAPVVTAAAVVMVSVFAIFLTLSDVSSKQYGLGLAVAILIDATVIRGVLLPAVMRLLGEWNWYLPRALRWLPEPLPS
jgi:uncharacterized membrane protein YdfJ with MMPL/SSD domain